MKKLLTCLLAVLAALTVRAGEEDAVKKVFTTITSLACDMKYSATMPYYTEDYTTTSADGKTDTKADLAKASALLDLVAKEDASATEILSMVASLQGHTLSANEREAIRKMEKTTEGRQRIQVMRDKMKAKRNEIQTVIRKQAATFRFIRVQVDGNRAVAVWQERESRNNKLIEHTCELIKQDGKWLIRRDNGKYVKEK